MQGPMTEPTDETAARGPHVPDRLASIPALAWLFVVLAFGDLVWLVRRLDTTGASPLDLLLNALGMVPSIAAVLIPAALLWRHPDARSRARTLLFGTILFAAVEGLQILREPLQPFFERVTPPSAELTALVPLSAGYDGLVSLVGSFGLLYIAVGLSRARRYEDRSGIAIRLIVPIAAALAAASGLVAISQIPDTIVITSTVVIFLGAQLILGVITVVAWSYLTMTTLRGVRAGEDPRSGWALATLGGALVLAAIVLASLAGVVRIQDAMWTSILYYLTLGGYSFGHLALLLAFVAGLPSLEEDEDEDVDDAEAPGL